MVADLHIQIPRILGQGHIRLPHRLMLLCPVRPGRQMGIGDFHLTTADRLHHRLLGANVRIHSEQSGLGHQIHQHVLRHFRQPRHPIHQAGNAVLVLQHIHLHRLSGIRIAHRRWILRVEVCHLDRIQQQIHDGVGRLVGKHIPGRIDQGLRHL